MHENSDDSGLLALYVRDGHQPAFRELVERHIGLVNCTALRVASGDAHLAQDVAQQVFADLARKAGSLPPGTVLGGWLYRHTCFTAAKAIRTESRRRAREKTAMELSAMNENPAPVASWEKLSPVLDDALNHLDEEDRDAVVLRFFQQRNLRSIGHSLRVSEDAAQKRVARALEKLRGFLERRGVTLSTALLATTLDAGAKTSAPAGMAATVSASALHSAAIPASFTLTSLKTMITSKLALGAAAAVALAGIATVTFNREPAPTGPTAAPIAQAPALPAVPKVAAVVPAPAVAKPAARVELPTAAPQTGIGPAAPTVEATPMNDVQIVAAELVDGTPQGTALTRTGTLVLQGQTFVGATVVTSGELQMNGGEAQVITHGEGTVIFTDGNGAVLQISSVAE